MRKLADVRKVVEIPKPIKNVIPHSLVGTKHGKWTVLKYCGKTPTGLLFIAECECGNIQLLKEDALTNKPYGACYVCDRKESDAGDDAVTKPAVRKQKKGKSAH